MWMRRMGWINGWGIKKKSGVSEAGRMVEWKDEEDGGRSHLAQETSADIF